MLDASESADVSKDIMDGSKSVAAYSSLSAFAIDNMQRPWPSIKVEDGGQMRYELGGGLQVIVIKYFALRSVFMASLPVSSTTFKEAALRHFMQDLPQAAIDKLKESGSIYQLKRFMHDMSYVPSVWYAAECPDGQVPFWGSVRRPLRAWALRSSVSTMLGCRSLL